MAQPEDDLRALIAEAYAHVSWEAQVGGIGVPVEERRPLPAQAKGNAHDRVGADDVGVNGGVNAGAVSSASPASSTQASTGTPTSPSTITSTTRPTPTPAAQAWSLTSPSPGGASPSDSTEGAKERLSPEERRARLAVLAEQVKSCTRCDLAKGRTQTVFARGNPDSPLMFVGEGPGQEEDRQGLPFVGPAGMLLDKMIAAMGYGRDDVYICNVVKCRPPNNRTPLPSEAGACAPFLHAQIDTVQPKVIVALGRCAAENMGLVPGGGSWRGRWGKYRGVDVMPTYHPAFLLRSPEFKRPVWEDLQRVMARLKERA